MAECINCGEYTKFNGGLCYSCYKKDGKSKDVAVEEREPEKKEITKKTKKTETKENPWISGVIKGRIAETIVEELFRSLGFQVFSRPLKRAKTSE